MKTINNQIRKSKFSITVLAFAIISMFSIGCTPPPPPPSCNTTNTLFHQIYNNVVAAPGNVELNTMDSYVHGYNFTVSTNKIICGVGYQSQPAVASQLYKIEIIDNTTSTTLYNFSTTFSTTTSYVSVPNISVIPGHSYTIRRTLMNDLGNVMNRIGKLVTSSTYTIPFPYTVGDLTITQANFGTVSVPSNFGLPFIDISFQ